MSHRFLKTITKLKNHC